MSIFNLTKYNNLFRENTENNYYLQVEPIVLAYKDHPTNEPDFWSFIRKYRELGAIATSKNMRTFMNISSVPITREMLVGLAAQEQQNVKLFGARVYVEVDEVTTIGPSSAGKYLKALHPAERERMSWDALWQAIQDYPIITPNPTPELPLISGELILESELSAFMAANGYNTEEEI